MELLETAAAASGWDWLVLLSSGLLAALVSAFVAYQTAKRGLEHDSTERIADRKHQAGLQADALDAQKASQEADREHARLQREEEEHARARADFIDGISDFQLWVDHQWHWTGLAGEVDYHPVAVAKGNMQTPEEALAYFQRLATAHPSRFVREAAHKVYRDIYETHNNQPQAHGPHGPVNLDAIKRWDGWARTLAEALHDPRPTERIDLPPL